MTGGNSNSMLILTSIPGPRHALYPLHRMWCKFTVKTTFKDILTRFRVKLSRLLGEKKIFYGMVGLEPPIL